MTALSLSAIPSGINTYERLAVWAIQCLQDITNGAEVNVLYNEPPSLAAQSQVSVTADGKDRFILSAYVPLSRSALNSQDQKTWMAAQDMSSATPHTNFLSN